MREQRANLVILESLVAAAGDEPDIGLPHSCGGHREQRLVHGIKVGGLRVVHEFHAVDFGNEFAAMRRWPVSLQRPDHCLERHAQDPAHGQRGHEIFRVVRTGHLTVFHLEQRAGPAVQAADQHAAVEMDVRATIVRAEGDDLRRDVHLERAQLRQRLALHDGPVEWLLVLKNARLGQRVVGHVAVTVKMIGREVQQHRDARAKVLDGLELKRAGFEHEKIEPGRLLDDGADRRAVGARRHRLEAIGLEDAFDEFRGRGLPVGAGDRDVQAERVLVAELELAEDRQLAAVHLGQQRIAPRHAGADHDKIKRRHRRRD